MQKLRSQLKPTILLLTFFMALWWQISAYGQSDPRSKPHVMTISQGLDSPLRIAIDDQDDVYVTNAVAARVCRYDSEGNFVSEFQAGGFPLAVSVAPHHQLYVIDRVTGALQLFDASGQLIRNITDVVDRFDLPSDAVTDDHNQLYVVDGRNKCVHKFDGSGAYLTSFGDDVLVFPTGIAFDKKNQRLLVAEHGGLNVSGGTSTSKMIHAFDPTGQYLTSFGEYGFAEGQFTRIQGLAVDQQGRIYAVDTFQGAVTILAEDGAFLASIGQYGRQAGELRAPMDVAIDSRQRIWVTSMNNGRIEVYGLEERPTSIASDPELPSPSRFQLLQNYPNPFNPSTRIPFVLGKDSRVVIRIYNELGQLIRRFDLGRLRTGQYLEAGHAVFWDGTNEQGELVGSGVYLYEIRTDDAFAIRRMLLIK